MTSIISSMRCDGSEGVSCAINVPVIQVQFVNLNPNSLENTDPDWHRMAHFSYLDRAHFTSLYLGLNLSEAA